jgi:phosphoribosylcarboxyaminoimidazole (NCAIR) mutase
MRILAILACVVSVPVHAFGQAAIGGVVSDPSGAPVAGVVVEASSAALIEKTRITLTDRAGRYRAAMWSG